MKDILPVTFRMRDAPLKTYRKTSFIFGMMHSVWRSEKYYIDLNKPKIKRQ